ncbi:MAG: toxic anion resistance protein [Oscillospiraceae bacterium]|nr:toxic anion resistance protein [Oscillospiraceae bacterium]MCI8720194.1 toxic anion resistance protein [Oscillospiraceae bacterium]MCI8943006.1 toxic anion resistance protein [Oscillospiraceae bacterium]
MTDMEGMMPELTLNADAAKVEAPSLTLSLEPEAPAAAAEPEKPKVEPVVIDDSMLNEAEKKMVDDFAKKIDISDSQLVLQYGAAAQKSVASFSENALSNVRNKDLGEIGDTLTSLTMELKSLGQEEEEKGLFGFFKKAGNRLETMKVQYSKAEVNVEKIARELEQHQRILMKDIAMFDQMYELNLKYYKELTMYIIAGKKRLAEVQSGQLEELRKKAEATGAQEDAQAYNDLAQMCNRFDKKLHDLELTRMVSIQMGPQTRMLQNNDTLMVEKIQSSLVNTIPLWKSQMVLALGLENSRKATAAQTAVTNATNELLKKNAEMLKMGTIATAKEAERSIIDIETLQHTNQQLISTLDEVIQIQKEGAQKRKEAEVELGRIEGELRQKLMELRS